MRNMLNLNQPDIRLGLFFPSLTTCDQLQDRCTSIGQYIGIYCDLFRAGICGVNFVNGSIWYQGGRTLRHDHSGTGTYRVLTHYAPDFLYHRLGYATFEEGEALLPHIVADPDALCCFRAALDNPLDDAALNALSDRLLELGFRS